MSNSHFRDFAGLHVHVRTDESFLVVNEDGHPFVFCGELVVWDEAIGLKIGGLVRIVIPNDRVVNFEPYYPDEPCETCDDEDEESPESQFSRDWDKFIMGDDDENRGDTGHASRS